MRVPKAHHWIFWEVDAARLDTERDCSFILGRALESGGIDEIRWLIRSYGLPRIHAFFRDVGDVEITERTRRFWRHVLHAENEQWADPRGLAKEQRRALDRLKQVQGVERFYLAGGCAVAHHVNHRTSADLDSFSTTTDQGLDRFQAAIRKAIPDAEVLERSDVTLRLRVEGVPVDVVDYPYPLLRPVEPGPEGFPVAAPLDLAVMKLAAIARRGIRRDFWDLHELLLSGLTLPDVASGYLKRFKKAEPDLYHVLRALTWFEDAERQSVFPEGLTLARWKKIRRYFEANAPLLISTVK